MVRWTAVTVLSMFLIFGNYDFKDIGQAITYYGQSISSTHPLLGSWIFVLIIIFVIFSKEIYSYSKTLTQKVKLKENF